jgi:hypothetical protein
MLFAFVRGEITAACFLQTEYKHFGSGDQKYF